MKDSLPVIELSGGGDIAAVRVACERHGFFYISGHGVDPALVHPGDPSPRIRAWRIVDRHVFEVALTVE